MTIAILGYGKEGKSVENYFKKQNIDTKVFDNFTEDELKNFNLDSYEMVFRSPGVKPFNKNWSSSTKYFFDNCICPIIGVTGTKGKGTTCSMITAILEALGKKVYLVGNIGNPSLDILDKIRPEDVVVYEMSSFQLWDLYASPKISVILRIEPDHLNVHKDFEDYVGAKSHIAEFQSNNDSCIYFKDNKDSKRIAEKSKGKKYTYPIEKPSNNLTAILDALNVPGNHNRENAEAALLASATFFNLSLEEFLEKNKDVLISAFSNFTGLPHRCQFLRELNGVKYYDDNFSTTVPSFEVALKAFPNENKILIIGGRDKTHGENYPKIIDLIKNTSNIQAIVLIGESGHEIFEKYKNENLKFILAESLEEAVNTAKDEAEKINNSIVLMSPAAASFDMFKNVYDRGEQYQNLIKNLK
ncbi:UDP-N-acetylmuramoyl-L-alanine--D-glutamate ligase [Candidatus Saccharibacteria bacterium]|nr:UDP-N-acetylmuramoyl-L-alanine--D-glutamate ligase [Candidatus Saccharibacteria bacterium]